MSPKISDKFRIYNAEQFLSALGDDYYNEVDDFVAGPYSQVERDNMYFFVGRPQNWGSTLEIYNQDALDFQVGEDVFVGADLATAEASGFAARVTAVYEYTLLLEDIRGASATASKPTAGDTLNGNVSGATATTGLYRYGDPDDVPDPLDNDAEYFELYDDMIAAKRMTVEYTRAVVARYTWSLAAGAQYYDMYRNDYSPTNARIEGKPGDAITGLLIPGAYETLGASKFYVMNQNYEVWKCIYNGSELDPAGQVQAVPALRRPTRSPALPTDGVYDGATGFFAEDTGTFATAGPQYYGPGIFPTQPYANGYVWKFMFQLPVDDVLRFLSTDFMPIPNNISATDGSDRANTESLAIDGAVDSYLIEKKSTTLVDRAPDSGVGYFAPVLGDGTGAVAEIFTSGNEIVAVKAAVRGSGYTYGHVAMVDGASVNGAAYGLFNTLADAQGTGATGGVAGLVEGTVGAVEVIIGPKGGHGAADATAYPGNERLIEREFNAKRIMTNIRLAYAEGKGDFPVQNDFRRIGIIRNPESADLAARATELSLTNLKSISLNGVGANAFAIDGEITQTLSTGGTAKGRVVSTKDYGSGKVLLRYYQSRIEHTDFGVVRAFEDSTTAAFPVVQASTSAQGNVTANDPNTDAPAAWTAELESEVTITNGVADTEFVRDTGDVIYLENRRLITRAEDQIEDIKLVIEF